MSTRYGHGDAGGGQDEGERRDRGWRSRQGGDQSREPGRRGEPGQPERGATTPPAGTNTQGQLPGIGEAADASARRLDASHGAESGDDGREGEPLGTDQPPRMGGPLGGNPGRPHLPEGVQTSDTQGSGAGGFDRGVNAKPIGEVHQAVRDEDPRDATRPGEPGAISGGSGRG